jgi:gamma-glutamyl-gamma-aminobutyrate hydrolase PuuD
MRVALTMRITQAQGYAEPRDSISHDWLNRLAAWQATPFLVPNIGSQATSYLGNLNADILVLTGGDDIGRTPKRDETETALLNHALSTGLAVLGVCRGMQLINQQLGGRLCSIEGHVATPHTVSFAGDWIDFYGSETNVNSYHETAIPADGVGANLATTAIDADGHVEGFHHTDHPLAGIMWHPERDGVLEGDRLLMTAISGLSGK